MKNIITTLVFVFAVASLFAQQEPHNTQFMQFKLGYNPAYAGSTEAPCITCIYRNQWIGLDGSPEVQIVSFNMPMANQRVGIGANFKRSTVGIFESHTVDAVYNYRFRLGKGMLGIGVQASIRSLEGNFQKTESTQPKNEDTAIPQMQQDKFLFNFGAGAYYSTELFYFGVSIPRFLTSNIDFADLDQNVSREVRHFYIMGGIIFPLGEKVKIQPQTLIKYVVGAPLDADANVNFIFSDKYIVGATYRIGGNSVSGVGESVDILLAMQMSSNLLFGVSYDITLSDLKDYNNGSIEASLHYCFGKSEEGEYINPRFF